MHIYVHANMYTYIHDVLPHIFIHRYTYRHIYIHIHACLPTYKHIYMHTTYMYVCIHTYMCPYIHVGSWMFVYALIHAYIHGKSCMPHRDTDTLATQKHASIHICTGDTFQPRNIILGLSIYTISRVTYLPYFQIS